MQLKPAFPTSHPSWGGIRGGGGVGGGGVGGGGTGGLAGFGGAFGGVEGGWLGGEEGGLVGGGPGQHPQLPWQLAPTTVVTSHVQELEFTKP